jgi:hypothetical protein
MTERDVRFFRIVGLAACLLLAANLFASVSIRSHMPPTMGEIRDAGDNRAAVLERVPVVRASTFGGG